MSFEDGIFLSGLWRSGSTYIWSEFRKSEGTYCFYEPLNQGLGRLNRKRVTRYNPEVTKVNTHPVLEKPYFAEFEPLMKRWRGVKNFKRRFAYDRFAMLESEEDPALARYLENLCDHARGQNRLPVLGFNRTPFRLQWLKKNFAALTVHIDRGPRDIWNSYMRLTHGGNYTYFLIWLTIIERNAGNLLFRPLAEKLKTRSRMERLYTKPKKYYRRTMETITPEETYEMVFYLWCATALHALSHADFIIDIGLAGEADYNLYCANVITQLTGLHVDLSGLRPDTTAHSEIDFATVEAQVMRYFPAHNLGSFINRARILSRLGEIAPEKAALIERLV